VIVAMPFARYPARKTLCVMAALYLALQFLPFRAELAAQIAAGDSAGGLVGQRIIILQGMGAVHLAGTEGGPRTTVGINLVMPVRRVEGRQVWVVSTSGGDSGWVDIGSVRPLAGAIEYFDSLITNDPTNWDAYLRRAEAEHALNKRDAATKDYSNAIELHPSEAFLYLRRGRHYNTLKECAKETADFDRAIELAPRSAHQDYNLVAELHSLKAGVYSACPDTTYRDYALGLALARQAVDEDPSRATLVTILAAAYALAGDFPNAVKAQRQALARPDFPPGYRDEAERALARYLSAAGQKPR
jgi:tetratricopeptide (TPR) repeat protein